MQNIKTGFRSKWRDYAADEKNWIKHFALLNNFVSFLRARFRTYLYCPSRTSKIPLKSMAVSLSCYDFSWST